MMQIYVQIVECGNFMQVVDVLQLYWLVVIKVVQQFEQEFGVWLLNCSMCCVSVMVEGEVFYVCCVQLFGSIDDVFVLFLK